MKRSEDILGGMVWLTQRVRPACLKSILVGRGVSPSRLLISIFLMNSLSLSVVLAAEPAGKAVESGAVTVAQGALDAAYKAGRAALEDGMYELAESNLKVFLADESTLPDAQAEAYIALIRTLYKQKKYEEILTLYKKNADKISPLPQADAFWYWRLAVLYELGDYAQAEKGACDFEKKQSGSRMLGSVKRLRAWCRLKMGDRVSAMHELEAADKIVTCEAEKAVGLLELSKIYASAGMMDKSLSVARDIQKIPVTVKESHEGMYWLATLLADKGETAEAITLLKQLVPMENLASDIKVRSWYMLGRLYGLLKDSEQALNSIANGMALAYDKALKEQGECEIGLLHLSQGNLKVAMPILKNYIRKDTDSGLSGEIHLKMAKAFLDAGESQQAAEEYQYYLEAFTNVQGAADAYMGKGWALYNSKRYAEAATCFTKAYGMFSLPGRKEQSLFKIADSYSANGQYNIAIESYKTFINEFSKSDMLADAVFQIADCYARLDDLNNALLYYRRVVSSFPGRLLTGDSMLRIADIHAKRKEYSDAVQSYDAVMNQYTNGVLLADSLLGRGMVYFEQGAYEQAIKDFEEVRNKFASTKAAESASFMMGLSCFKTGKSEQAVDMFKDFMVKYPMAKRAPEVLFWIGKHEYNAMKHEESVKYFLALQHKYPTNEYADDALLRAGIALAKSKEYMKANDVFNRLAAEYPAGSVLPEARFAQANVLFELGKLSPSILIYDELINKYPESDLVPSALMRKGDCQFTLGVEDPERYEESVKSFQSVVNHPKSTSELVIQANYKIGRCYEKCSKDTEALEYYYSKVIVSFLDAVDKGVRHTEAAKTWFTRAAFSAADILEARKEMKQVVSILQRVISADVPAAGEASERISRIKAANWWMFY